MVWYNLIYNIPDGQLARAQTFQEEQEMSRKGQRHWKQKVRWILLVILLSILYNATRAGPVVNLTRYFTNWSLLATTSTVLISIILSANPDWDTDKAINLHALHHLMYTLTMFMNPVVFLMYWSIIH